MNVPKLRFKDDDGRELPEWKTIRLGDIASFSKGKGISKADIATDGKTLCIRYGELYTEYGETIQKIKSRTNINSGELQLSESNDVIIPASGETQIDIAKASCVLIQGVALGGDLNIIRSNENGVFLSYYLNHQKRLDIAKLAQGNSVVHLYSSQLKLLDLIIPSKQEQTKIANFLTVVDEKISQLTQKCDLLKQYKKGVMQQIFSQKLRFKDDDGRDFPDWEMKKLGDTLDIVIDNRGKTPPIDNTGYPLLEVNAIGSKRIDYKAVTKYVSEETYLNWFRKHLQKNDVLFSTVGATAQCSFYEEENISVIAQNIVGLRFKKNYLGIFMFYLLTEVENNRKFKQIEMLAVQPSIKVSQMIHLSFDVPSLPEQTKIANFLTAIDDKIIHAQTQLDAVKQYKKGLLQQLFV